MLAVWSNETTTTWPPYGMPGQVRVAEVAAVIPAAAWQRLSCGEGAQGLRGDDWALVPVQPALRAGWVHALLALAALAIGAAKRGTACPQHIPFPLPEIRRLLVRLAWTATRPQRHPCLVPLAAPAPARRSGVPPPSPPET